MKTRFLSWLVAIAAITPFAVATPRAAADTITLNYTGGGITQSVFLNGSTSNVTGGPFNWNVTAVPPNVNLKVGNSITTWCVELAQGIASPTTYTLASVSTLPNATSIMNLFGEGYKTGSPSNAAAFQLALWELVYDTSAGSLTAGNFRYTGSSNSTRNAAQTLLSQALHNTANGINSFNQFLSGYTLYHLDSATKQNQLLLVPPGAKPPTQPPVNPVPAPPAALLALFGVLALGGRSTWFRKKAPTA